jgi:pSer/pThr/pTyr-binding forkhead associated (FHA) protein
MGFQLVIAEGKETGREFVFEQASVLVGRTSDCDVVLYDPGVSRQHARIFTEGAKYFVEDMGSSNGTKVNGAIVKRKQLADGDNITLGPVVFNFASIVLDDAPAEDPHNSTRIVAASEVKRSRGKGVAMVPENAAPDQLAKLSRSSTQTLQAVSKPRNAAVSAGGGGGGAVSRPPRLSSPGAGAVARPSRPERGGSLSASERARIKREQSGALANFSIWWAETTQQKRNMVMGGAGVVGLAVIGLVANVLLAEDEATLKKKLPPEPTELSGTPVEHSFGLGDDVQYERSDQKEFQFAFSTPVEAVVLLHFQAKDVSAKEVLISVNGSDVGEVPADNMSVNERMNEILVPAGLLKKKGEPNIFIFDNVKNPPSSDPWRVWNIYVEVALLPPLPQEELVAESEKKYNQGLQLFERRSIGAANLYNAWKAFRTAWLYMESMPEPRPQRYGSSRDKMKEVQVELDKVCAKLLLEAQGYYNQKDYPAARKSLDHVLEFFPIKDQACPFRAQALREAMEI